MEVSLYVHPQGRRYRHGGGEMVMHLTWHSTAGSTETRGQGEGRERMIQRGWMWEMNAVQMPVSWHCFTILWPKYHGGNRTLI